jgi:polyribonucleotide nucleotidyltransferase
MLEAIMFGHDEIKRLIVFQEEIAAAVGKEKRE